MAKLTWSEVERLITSTNVKELEEAWMDACRTVFMNLELAYKGNTKAQLRTKEADLVIRITTSRLKMIQRLKSMKKSNSPVEVEVSTNDADASRLPESE